MVDSFYYPILAEFAESNKFNKVSIVHSLYRTNRTDTQLDVLCCQQGVYRVNCLDCLDRTNVIQSQICKEILLSVVSDLVAVCS